MMSARANDTASAKLLLENGAVAKAKGFAGFTALISAAGYGNTELVKLLLARGADVNAQSDPVFLKVKNGISGSAASRRCCSPSTRLVRRPCGCFWTQAPTSTSATCAG